MTASTASVQFRSGGVASVDASLRLTGCSYIQCCTYPDRPSILGNRSVLRWRRDR